jgi:hypothetical protein
MTREEALAWLDAHPKEHEWIKGIAADGFLWKFDAFINMHGDDRGINVIPIAKAAGYKTEE